MHISLFDKIELVFKYMFSSFLSIELVILTLLLFLLLISNVNYKNKYVNMIIVIFYLMFAAITFITCIPYVEYSIDSLIKKIMQYIYFPSTIVYFFIIMISVVMIIYSLFSIRMTNFKKIFNYFVFNFIILFYLLFVVVCSYSNVDISDLVSLYTNNIILSLVQIGNLLFFGWCLFTLFYKLFLFFKNTYDKEN